MSRCQLVLTHSLVDLVSRRHRPPIAALHLFPFQGCGMWAYSCIYRSSKAPLHDCCSLGTRTHSRRTHNLEKQNMTTMVVGGGTVFWNCNALLELKALRLNPPHLAYCTSRTAAGGVTVLMAGPVSSIGRAHELLRELRLGIRRIEVAGSGTRKNSDDDSWTRSAIEVCAVSSSIYKYAGTSRVCRLDERGSWVDQELSPVLLLLLLPASSNTFNTNVFLTALVAAPGHSPNILSPFPPCIPGNPALDNALHRFQGFNNEIIRTVAACREALTEARYEAEQSENGNSSSADGSDALVKVTTNQRQQ